jgi:hypothetical protein
MLILPYAKKLFLYPLPVYCPPFLHCNLYPAGDKRC